MKTKKAAWQGGRNKERYDATYLKHIPRSRLKLAIGELLLFGNKQRQEFWQFFEVLLSQFYQASPQNTPKRHLERPGWTNAGQRVNR